MKNIRLTMTNLPLYTLGAIALIAATVAVFAMFSTSKDTTAWLEQAKLSPADGGFSDYFGATVAMDGDTIVVGASEHKLGGLSNRSGAAYIYIHSGSSWLQQAKLPLNNNQKSYRFGQSVAIDGNTAVVGAHDYNPYSTGSVYIFTRTNSTWSQQVQLGELLPPSPKKVYSFGYSVDVDGDTAVVAATRTAYVFTRNPATGSWSYQAELKATDGNDLPNATNPPHIEKIIAMSGNTIIYGSYIFIRDPKTGDWSQQAQLLPRGLSERAKYE